MASTPLLAHAPAGRARGRPLGLRAGVLWLALGLGLPLAGAAERDPARAAPAAGSSPRDSGAVGDVIGRVTSSELPVGYANVQVSSTDAGCMTDEQGVFHLSRVPVGSQALIVRSIGCNRESVRVEVAAGRVDSVLVELLCPFLLGPCRSLEFTPKCFLPNPRERMRVGLPCSAHPRLLLEPDTVRITYGLVAVPRGYVALERDSFPNARETWNGGCDLSSWNPTFAEVVFCRECRAAFERWLQRMKSGR